MPAESFRKMIIVADDAAFHPAVDRGIRIAAEKNALTHADFMLGQQYPKESLLSLKRDFPDMGIGLHIYMPGMADTYPNALANYWYRLHPNEDIRKKLSKAAESQLKSFQDITGQNPIHVSTHGHLNINHKNQPFDWFTDVFQQFLSGDFNHVLIRGIQTQPIRHTRFRSQLLGKKPLTPVQFKELLSEVKIQKGKILELVVHPAMGGPNEEKLPAAYSISLREKDLSALIAIINSGVIEEAGFKILREKE
ncbi:MAG: ChbG/HpnK family deacetylase [Candidatus Roizmanbacteria bacterium]